MDKLLSATKVYSLADFLNELHGELTLLSVLIIF